jgi:ligand-binding sensor domain-containing protein
MMRLFIIWGLLFCLSAGYGQEYRVKQFTTVDGLPSNSIRAIFKDSRGIMWFGTDAGVCRYDGLTFKTVNTTHGLAGNKVWSITEDADGNLWFGCFQGGISCFDGIRMKTLTQKDGLVDNSVRIVHYSPNLEALVIGTNESISVWHDSVFTNFTTENGSLQKDVIVTSILDYQDRVFVADFSSCHYQISVDSVDSGFVITPLKDKPVGNYGVSSGMMDKNDFRILGWQRKGVVRETADGWEAYDNIGQVFGIAEDDAGAIWAASWHGGISPPGGLFRIKDGKVTRCHEKFGLTSILGWSLFYDSQQRILWYGTLDNGLYQLLPQYFTAYPAEYFGESSMRIEDINFDSTGKLWILADTSLMIWNGQQIKKVDLIKFLKACYKVIKKYQRNRVPGVYSSLPRNFEEMASHFTNFSRVNFDSKGNPWITIEDVGIFGVDSTYKITHYEFFAPGPFYIAPGDTFYQSDSWSNAVNQLVFDDGFKRLKQFFGESPVYGIKVIGNDDEIWVCSRLDGIWRVKDDQLINISNTDSTINRLANDIAFDGEGTVYIAGVDGRIELLDQASGRKTFEIVLDPAPPSVSWLQVVDGHLFGGYSDGLRIFRISDLKNHHIQFQYFSENEGYAPVEVRSSVVDSMGDILLGTRDGILKIQTNLVLADSTLITPTVFDNIELHGTDTLWASITETDRWSGNPVDGISLASDQDHLTFFFHALNYQDPTQEVYEYKLEGTDEAWTGPIMSRLVLFPNLAPGKYQFMVRNTNLISGKTSDPVSFAFTIRRPWYESGWFVMVVIIFIGVVFFLTLWIRTNGIRKREAQKRAVLSRISELETKALQAQMNPHFIFNAISSIQNYMLDNEVDDALKFLNHLSRVIRMTLEQVDKKSVTLQEKLDYLAHYVTLEQMRFDDAFSYEVMVDPSIDPENIRIPPMILQPIIENAIKHGLWPKGKGGFLHLEIIPYRASRIAHRAAYNEDLFVVIEDNGIGRKASGEKQKQSKIPKTSKGIKLTLERLRLFNKGEEQRYDIRIIDLVDDDGNALGTRVEVVLPGNMR